VWKSLGVALVLSGSLAGPAGSIDPIQPDGVLVLGVAGHGTESRVVTREWAAVADPSSGTIRKRRLSGGALCHGPVLAVGEGVVFSGHRGRRAVAQALPLTLTGQPRVVGLADTFAPSFSHGRLWLGRWRGRREKARLGLHQVDLNGHVTVSARILGSRWGSLHAALRRGFVLTVRDSLVVWDHWPDRPARAIPGAWFVAAGDSHVAWCRGNCERLHVWSRRGERALPPPAGTRPLGAFGSVSPDDRQLATGVTVDGRTRVAVVDLHSGAWTLVPGSKLGGYNSIAWSPSGRWLYFTDSNEGLRAWHVGAAEAVALAIDPGGTVMSIATTP
jgi:hypothetical protein